MRPFPKVLAVLAMVFTAVFGAYGLSQADDRLDAYRANGVIAERYDGYVEIRDPNAPSGARALVQDVNARRRALYGQRADESNVPVEEVGKLFATKIVGTAPPGTYFRQPSGDYVRK